MNFTSPSGKFLHVCVSTDPSGKIYGGNMGKYADAKLTRYWVKQMQAQLRDDPEAINFLTRFKPEEYVIVVDGGFIDPRRCYKFCSLY